MTHAPLLTASTLAGVEGARLPAYDRDAATAGIVHLGLGAFARAHVATYADDLLAAGHTNMGICGISLHSRSTVDAMRAQDGLYTVIERESDEAALRIVGSVLRADHGPAAAVDAMSAPGVHTVTLTVTEKGYCRAAATGELDWKHPDLAHDLSHPDEPRSVPGVLVAALRRRRDGDLPPPIVISCDNLHHNGRALARATTEFADRFDPVLAQWIREHVSFPATVVDRIVPAPTESDRALVVTRTGLTDECPVACEPFRQLVIEDTPGLARLGDAGATIVDTIDHWETLKLRLLNGTHSALAYLGLAAGIDTVAEAVADPALEKFATAMAEEEVIPTLPDVAINPSDYAASCRRRFANPTLGHRTAQVAMDGSQKLPPRILDPMLAGRERGLGVDRLALVVAAWMRHLVECANGARQLDDPLAAELLSRIPGPHVPAADLADHLLEVDAVFPAGLRDDHGARHSIIDGLELLEEVGPLDAAAKLS